MENYFDLPQLSSTDIKNWISLGNPQKWKYLKENRVEKKSEALTLGSLVHALLLEPETFENSFIISPYSDFRKKEAKEWKQSQTKEIITEAQFQQASDMVYSIQEHEKESGIFERKGHNEKIFTFVDPETQLELKFKPDRIVGSSIIDLKTSNSAHPDEFAKSVINYNYHVQDAFYSLGFKEFFGVNPKHFFFIVVEKTQPFAVARYELGKEEREIGNFLLRKSLREIANCIEKDQFLGYNGESKYSKIHFPKWYLNKFEINIGE